MADIHLYEIFTVFHKNDKLFIIRGDSPSLKNNTS